MENGSRNANRFNHGRALSYTEEDERRIGPRERFNDRSKFEFFVSFATFVQRFEPTP